MLNIKGSILSKIMFQLRNNWIIILPISSAAASFILSFWLKVILTPEDYGDFATAFFTINVLLGLGVVGYDQVIIRLSKLTEYGLEIDKWIVIIGVLLLLLTPGLSFAFLSTFGVVTEFSLGYLILSWSAACIAVLAILFNLQGRLLESYLFLGSWKVVLLLMVAVLYSSRLALDEIELLIMLALVSTFFWLIVFRKRIFYLVRGQLGSKSVYLLYFSSVISLFSYHAFENLDRFLLLSNFDKVIFGDYFFVLNFLLSPTSIFVSYYSVKRLSLYKKSFLFLGLLYDYAKVSIFSIIITFFLVLGLLILQRDGIVAIGSIDNYSLILIGCLAVFRCSYSILSVAYRVVASKMTLIGVAFLFLVLSFSVYYSTQNSYLILDVMIVFCLTVLLWFLRSVIYLLVIFRDSRMLLKLR